MKVAVVEATDADLNVLNALITHRRTQVRKAAYGALGVPVFRFAGELFGKTVDGRVSHHRSPPGAGLLDHPLRMVANYLFGSDVLFLELLQTFLISSSLFLYPLLVDPLLVLHLL